MEVSSHIDETVIPNQLCDYCTQMVSVYTSSDYWEPDSKADSAGQEEGKQPPLQSGWTFGDNEGPEFRGPQVDFYETISQFLDSVEHGCHICSLFRRILRRYEDRYPRKGRLMIEPCEHRFREEDGCQKVALRLIRSGRPLYGVTDQITMHRHRLNHNQTECTAGQSVSRKDSLEMQHQWSSSTRSLAGFKVIRTWLQSCIDEHPTCRASLLDCPSRPTRLLDLEAFSDSEDLRLVDDQDLPAEVYATLSYRWGASNPVILKRENYSQMRIRIRFTDLPRSIREAIGVCRELSVRYLWVDALCICQDRADDDFKREIANMGSIYAESLFTIAAADSVDCESGLFRNRCPLYRQDCIIESGTIQWVFQASLKDCGAHDFRIGNSHLNERGWVLQEALMSPRTIHFTSEDIVWECRERTFCPDCSIIKDVCDSLQRGRQGAGNMLWEARGGNSWDPGEISGIFLEPIVTAFYICEKKVIIGLLQKWIGHSQRLNFQIGWQKVLVRYTKTKLTTSDDRLSALAGIAQLIQSKLQYTASYGLWLDFFVDQLQWFLDVPVPERNDDAHKQVPSWSWLSVDTEINTVQNDGERIRTARISRYPPITGFQPLSDLYQRSAHQASFTVYGSIRPCQAYPSVDRGSVYWDIAPVSEEISDSVEASIKKQWDLRTLFMEDELGELVKKFRFEHTSMVDFFPDVFLNSRETLFCFLLSRRVYGNSSIIDRGLVLRQDDRTPTRYRRVGYFSELSFASRSSSQDHTSHPLTDGGSNADIPTNSEFGNPDVLETSGRDGNVAISFLPMYGPKDATGISSSQSPAEPLENDSSEEHRLAENDSQENDPASHLLASCGTEVSCSESEVEGEVFKPENPQAAHWTEQIEKLTFFNGSEIDVEIEIF